MFDFDWDSFYQSGAAPWETKHPSTELRRVIAEEKLQPCRTIELVLSFDSFPFSGLFLPSRTPKGHNASH